MKRSPAASTCARRSLQRAERIGADTRYEGIVRLMRTAMTDRPPVLRAADRVAGPFLWGVLVLAALAAAAWSFIDPSRAVWVAVSVLIVTCPCALSLAAPSALLAAAGALVRRGVLVQRFDALESLAGVDTVCFDKTGTLTAGAVLRSSPPSCSRRLARSASTSARVRAIAAALASLSTHPLARAIADSARRTARRSRSGSVREYPGLGVEGFAERRRRVPARRGRRGRPAARSARRPPTVRRPGSAGPTGALARFGFAEVLRDDARAAARARCAPAGSRSSCSPATPRRGSPTSRAGSTWRTRAATRRPPTSSPRSPRCRPQAIASRWSATASTTLR